ncbi:MAG: Rieske 2Fe-2S domain-containing protein [bacterium]|nr:Rieske 2Fe-2S domain-containing protein [bacterium]
MKQKGLLAGKISELPPGNSKSVPYEKFDISLFHTEDGKFFAIKEECPHAGVPLTNGSLCDGVVTCPGHSWQFRLQDGQCVYGDEGISIKTLPVVVEGDQIWIQI